MSERICYDVFAFEPSVFRRGQVICDGRYLSAVQEGTVVVICGEVEVDEFEGLIAVGSRTMITSLDTTFSVGHQVRISPADSRRRRAQGHIGAPWIAVNYKGGVGQALNPSLIGSITNKQSLTALDLQNGLEVFDLAIKHLFRGLVGRFRLNVVSPLLQIFASVGLVRRYLLRKLRRTQFCEVAVI